MRELITVIVPIYNVEKYLDRCIISIVNQTYKYLEIILVDDGSTDYSGEICEKWKSRDDRIIVIHQENQGLGPARNAGLDAASGEWISFVDSDDWIELNTYEVMLRACIKNGCDISTCGRKEVSSDTIIRQVFCKEKSQFLNRVSSIRHYLLQQGMNMSACDKLFKRSLFDNIRFPKGLVSEDTVPIYRVIKRSNGIIMTGKPLYNYFYRKGSLSRSSFRKELLGSYIYAREVCNDVIKTMPFLYQEAESFEWDRMIGVYRSMRKDKYNGPEKDKFFRTFKSNYWRICKNSYVDKKQKIYVFFALLKFDVISDEIYKLIKRIYCEKRIVRK